MRKLITTIRLCGEEVKIYYDDSKKNDNYLGYYNTNEHYIEIYKNSTLSVLLHEILEYILTQLNFRYFIKSDIDYLFNFTHRDFYLIVNELTNAIMVLNEKKLLKRRKINGREKK